MGEGVGEEVIMSEEKHRVVVTDHRGQEKVLDKPLNESAMTQEQRQEWHRQRAKKTEVKK